LNHEPTRARLLDIENNIQKEGRILIRRSGTENLIRLMVEHNDQNKLEEILESCLNVLKKRNEFSV
jgi:phosphoglucosamine mutase